MDWKSIIENGVSLYIDGHLDAKQLEEIKKHILQSLSQKDLSARSVHQQQIDAFTNMLLDKMDKTDPDIKLEPTKTTHKAPVPQPNTQQQNLSPIRIEFPKGYICLKNDRVQIIRYNIFEHTDVSIPLKHVSFIGMSNTNYWPLLVIAGIFLLLFAAEGGNDGAIFLPVIIFCVILWLITFKSGLMISSSGGQKLTLNTQGLSKHPQINHFIEQVYQRLD